MKKELILHTTIYLFGLIIAVILYLTLNELKYIYGYLISSFFIFLSIFLSVFLNFKMINDFKKKDQEKRYTKKFVLLNCIKYLPILSLLLTCILISLEKNSFIDSFALLEGVIITIVIIYTSEFLKYKRIYKIL